VTRCAATCLLSVLWLLASSSAAQSSATLGLGDVLASVQAHHPLIAAERERLASAHGEALAARGAFDLSFKVQARSQVAGYYDPSRVDVLLEQPTPLLGADLYAGYRATRGEVADYYGHLRTLEGGELRGGLRVPLLRDRATDSRRTGLVTSDENTRAAKASVHAMTLSLERDAAQAYYEWVAAGLRVGVLREMQRLAERRDEQVRHQVEHGALAPIEALDNRRTVLERTRQLVGAERVLEQSALELSIFLRDSRGALRAHHPEELPQDLPAVDLEALASPLQAQQAEQRALAQRPEIARAQAKVSAAEAEWRLADAARAPKLEVFAEVAQDLGDGNAQRERELSPTTFEVGVTFAMPLQQRGASGKLDSARAKHAAATLEGDFVHDKIRVEIRDTLSQLRAAEAKLQAAQAGSQAAQAVAAGERERFERGSSTVLFVNLREQAAAAAGVARIDALLELLAARVRLQTSLGESLGAGRVARPR